MKKTKQGAEPCRITGRSHRNGGLLLEALGNQNLSTWRLKPNVQLSCEGTAEAEADNRCHSEHLGSSSLTVIQATQQTSNPKKTANSVEVVSASPSSHFPPFPAL